MQIYLVGGAVRDRLLGLPVLDQDWVVVGASADDMLRKGFRPVGKDFPVFLDPKTNEEYALARTERKVGLGYTGFDFNAAASVTLEDDLRRRDLTINAIAQTPDGVLIDPYHGRDDIDQKILRHVSPAFVEDPVRILRVARFAARFAQYGFTVAPETVVLMRQMVGSGEVDALVAERVWKELERGLAEKNPEQFFQVLDECGALRILFPQINLVEIVALKRVAENSPDTVVRFTAVLHGDTENEIVALCDRYKVPNEYRELALLVCRYMGRFCQVHELAPEEILSLLQAVDAFRREDRFKKFLLTCENLSEGSYSPLWEECYGSAKLVQAKEFLDAGFKGKDLAEKIQAKRIQALANVINDIDFKA